MVCSYRKQKKPFFVSLDISSILEVGIWGGITILTTSIYFDEYNNYCSSIYIRKFIKYIYNLIKNLVTKTNYKFDDKFIIINFKF